MTLKDLNQTLLALQKADVRFLIAGGLAVVAHGHSRVTHDLDIILALDSGNTARAIEVLTELGFKPRLPVPAVDFCDPAKRREWVEVKGLMVFALVNEAMNGLVVDIFAQEPFDFGIEWRKAACLEIPGFPKGLRFVSKATLLDMKRDAARPIDLDDIKHLEMLP